MRGKAAAAVDTLTVRAEDNSVRWLMDCGVELPEVVQGVIRVIVMV
jgi:hypothetical protein